MLSVCEMETKSQREATDAFGCLQIWRQAGNSVSKVIGMPRDVADIKFGMNCRNQHTQSFHKIAQRGFGGKLKKNWLLQQCCRSGFSK